MSLISDLEEITVKVPQSSGVPNACRMCYALASMTTEERDAINEALKYRTVTRPQLRNLLRKYGVDVSESTMTAHRVKCLSDESEVIL